MIGAPLGVVFGLAACVGEPAESATPADTAPVDPSPWTYTEDPSAPDLAAEALQAGAEAAVTLLGALDPLPLYEGYAQATANGNPSCPSPYPAVGVTTGWSSECTTATGWGFSGRSQAAWLVGATLEGQRYDRYGEFITTATLTHPSGATLLLDGRGTFLAQSDEAGATLQSELLGTYAYDPGDGAWLPETWMDAGPSVSLALTRSEDAAGALTATFHGGASHADLPDTLVGMRAESLVVAVDADVCTASGGLVLQGAEGQRYTLTLPAGSDCATCGVLERGGVAGAEVCVELEPLTTWERTW